MDCTCGREKPILLFNKICCFKTRTAGYILAAIELIIATIAMTFTAIFTAQSPWILYGYAFEDYKDFSSNFYNNPRPELPPPNYWKAAVAAILSTIQHATHFILSALLIHGIRKNILNLLRLWLWVRFMTVIDNLIDLVSRAPLYAHLFMALESTIAILIASVTIIIVRSHLYYVRLNEQFETLQEDRTYSKTREDPEDGPSKEESE